MMFLDLAELKTRIIISSHPDFTDLKLFLSERSPYSGVAIISDSNVFPLYGQSIIELLKTLNISIITPIVMDPGEHTKNLNAAQFCWEEMHRTGIDRQSVVIALGGGVITDLAGFVAGCYMRGIDVIHIPTTLMGMVDAALGGKTAVNIASGKNIVGIIHQPKLVFINPHCLQSLPEREFLAGLAEVVKYGIISDSSLFERLEKDADAIIAKDPMILNSIIERCCKIKSDIVEKDEREQGLRLILNLGHTFAHALETATHYAIYLHGEAVSIGMSCAFYTSHVLGLIDDSLIIHLHRILKKLKLPFELPDEPSVETLIDFMYGDKKTVNGKLNLILVKKMGEVESFINVDPQMIFNALTLKKQKKP